MNGATLPRVECVTRYTVVSANVTWVAIADHGLVTAVADVRTDALAIASENESASGDTSESANANAQSERIDGTDADLVTYYVAYN